MLLLHKEYTLPVFFPCIIHVIPLYYQQKGSDDMKRSELLKLLKKHGCKLVRNGSGGGLPIYHVHRTIDELDGKRFGDDTEIIYVNGQIQNDTMLGHLMHDFFCKNPADMRSKLLAERANFFKSNEHGVNNMCRIMEKIEKEGFAKGVAETTLKIIRNQLKRHIPYEEISEVTETPIDEVIRIAKESNLAY